MIPDEGEPAIANAGSLCGAGVGGGVPGSVVCGSRGTAYRCTSRARSSSLGADARQWRRTHTRSSGSVKL